MSADGGPVFVEKCCHLALGKPHGVVLQFHVE